MAKDKVIGAIVMIVGILIAVIYTMGSIIDLLFDTIWNDPDWDKWTNILEVDWLDWRLFVVAPLWLLVILISIIAIWIGYSMLTTPAPVPLEELEEELAAEEPAAEEPVAEEPSEAPGMDVYRIAILSDITSSNLWNLFGPGASAWNYVVQVGYWPGLFTLSDHRYDFVPQLAADYGSPVEQEGEYWVSTIPLKEGFLWSDGKEITAALYFASPCDDQPDCTVCPGGVTCPHVCRPPLSLVRDLRSPPRHNARRQECRLPTPEWRAGSGG